MPALRPCRARNPARAERAYDIFTALALECTARLAECAGRKALTGNRAARAGQAEAGAKERVRAHGTRADKIQRGFWTEAGCSCMAEYMERGRRSSLDPAPAADDE